MHILYNRLVQSQLAYGFIGWGGVLEIQQLKPFQLRCHQISGTEKRAVARTALLGSAIDLKAEVRSSSFLNINMNLDVHKRRFDTLQKTILKVMYGKTLTFSNILNFQSALHETNICSNIYRNKISLKLKEHKHSTRRKRNQYERKNRGKELANVVTRIQLQEFIHQFNREQESLQI